MSKRELVIQDWERLHLMSISMHSSSPFWQLLYVVTNLPVSLRACVSCIIIWDCKLRTKLLAPLVNKQNSRGWGIAFLVPRWGWGILYFGSVFPAARQLAGKGNPVLKYLFQWLSIKLEVRTSRTRASSREWCWRGNTLVWGGNSMVWSKMYYRVLSEKKHCPKYP